MCYMGNSLGGDANMSKSEIGNYLDNRITTIVNNIGFTNGMILLTIVTTLCVVNLGRNISETRSYGASNSNLAGMVYYTIGIVILEPVLCYGLWSTDKQLMYIALTMLRLITFLGIIKK